METGVLAGYPMVDIKASLLDGKYHEVDSSETGVQDRWLDRFQGSLREGQPGTAGAGDGCGSGDAAGLHG